MSNTKDSIELKPAPRKKSEAKRSPQGKQPIASLEFDYTVAVLCAWLIGGLYLDGWAHQHLAAELETFFTPWHALLYSGLFAVATFLTANLIRNRLKGYPWRWALPPGYNFSILGVLIFFIGGLCDLIWHQILGIEVGIEPLLSPPHLVLALGGAFIVTGPFRSAWQQVKPESAQGFWRQLPMLLSLTFLLSLLTFFTQFAHPFVISWVIDDVTNLQVDAEIYVMNADGSGQTRLTNNPRKEDFYPAWSPDGTTIAFTSDRDGNSEIYLMNADGINPTRLTNNEDEDSFPNWSPDGKQISFTSKRSGNLDIYVMNADGRNETQLTNSDRKDWLPAWAPAGSKIAFTSNRNENDEIYVMNADGSGETNISNNPARDWGASWSPDNTRIAFTSDRDGNSEIYVMSPNGGNQTRLTNDKASDFLPAWSPDGQRIAFASDREGSLDIYSMNPDGSDLINLTKNPGMRDGEWLVSWSPDGKKIAFASKGNFPGSQFLRQTLGIVSILLQTALLMGLVLLALTRWTLPVGSLTVIFTINAALMSVLEDQYLLIWVAIATSIIGEILMRWLKPSSEQPSAFRLLAFMIPIIFYSFYFLALILNEKMGWSSPLWTGIIVMSGIVGWLLSYLVMPPLKPADPQ